MQTKSLPDTSCVHRGELLQVIQNSVGCCFSEYVRVYQCQEHEMPCVLERYHEGVHKEAICRNCMVPKTKVVCKDSPQYLT